MPNLFARVPEWLRKALDTTQPELPNQLDTLAVVPVIDIGQGGFGTGDWIPYSVTHPANTGATTRTLLTLDQSLVRRVEFMEITHNGGAVAGDVDILVIFRPGAAETTFNFNRPSIGVGAIARVIDCLPTGPFILPPGFRLDISFPATAVGETYVANAGVLEASAGYRVT